MQVESKGGVKYKKKSTVSSASFPFADLPKSDNQENECV